MSGKSKKNGRDAENSEVNGSLMSAAKEDRLESAKKLVLSRALSHCKDAQGYALLCSAIKSGDIKSAKFLLQKGAKADCETCSGSPLHFAMRQTSVDLELVCLLLEKNATIDALNSRKETPLHLAAKKGCAEIVRALLDKNASVTAWTIEGSTPLLLAAEAGHEEVVCMLFEHACVNIKDLKDSLPPVSRIEKRTKTFLLHTAVKNGHKDFVALFLNSGFDANAKDEKGKTCLHYSVDCLGIVKLSLDGALDINAKNTRGNMSTLYSLNCEGDEECVEILQLLFANGADIKEAPELLLFAVRKRLIKVCRALIKNGADINAQDTNGNTPLHLTVDVEDWEKLEDKRKLTETIRYEIFKLLLYSGADVSIRASDGLTAFHRAVLSGRKKTVSFFLNCGVNVDLRAEDDSTPLHAASEKGFTGIVKILCENGANVDACRKDGWTALHLAARYGECEVVEILLDNSCDINAETIGTDTALNFAISKAISDYNAKLRWQYWLFINFLDSDYDVDDSVVALKRHIWKLKVAGLYVSQNNLTVSGNGKKKLKFVKKCAEEVSRMASKMLDSQLSLSDLLKTSRNLSLAESKLLLRALESFYFEEFPIYKSLLRNKFEKSKFVVELSIAGQESLDILVRASSKSNGRKCTVLPSELLELLVSFLNVCELRSLVFCGNTLKRQPSIQSFFRGK